MIFSSLLGHTHEVFDLVRAATLPADRLMNTYFRSHKYLGSTDRKFVAETAYGTLRHMRRLEMIVDHALENSALDPANRSLFSVFAYAKLIARDPQADVDGLLPLIKGKRTKKLISAIVKNLDDKLPLPEDPQLRIGIEHSVPDWLVRRLVADFSLEEAERICASMNVPAPTTLRTNTLKTSREALKMAFEIHGVQATETVYSPLGLRLNKRIGMFNIIEFHRGMFEMQDEGSQILVQMIDPKPTDKVLDACAGAGGKTLALAAHMNNRGEILATDIQLYRLEELKERSRRAGVHNIRIRQVDSLRRLEQSYYDSFDVVLVDAPCSGLGTMRRNPGMKWMVSEAMMNELAAKQRSILALASEYVKPGSYLYYATCTFLREENEDVVNWFLSEYPQFKVVKPKLIKGIETTSEGYVRLLPHVHGTDGFFIAAIKRASR